MRSIGELPARYEKIYAVDLQKDRGKLLLVNGTAVGIAAIMVVIGLFFVPVTALFDIEGGVGFHALRFAAVALGALAYTVLHEAVHGVAMRICGTKKVKYGFRGGYAFAASDDYYGKGAYIFIALAPVVLFGVMLGVLCALLPADWFWVAYAIQIFNCSGAAGDLFVTARFARMPRDILIRDYGVGMTVYAKK